MTISSVTVNHCSELCFFLLGNLLQLIERIFVKKLHQSCQILRKKQFRSCHIWTIVCRPFSKIFFEQIRESSCKRGKKYNHKARTKGLSLPKGAQGSNICHPLYQQTLHHGPKQKYQIISKTWHKYEYLICQIQLLLQLYHKTGELKKKKKNLL